MVYKSGQIFLPFCHNSRVWQTDRQNSYHNTASALHAARYKCALVSLFLDHAVWFMTADARFPPIFPQLTLDTPTSSSLRNVVKRRNSWCTPCTEQHYYQAWQRLMNCAAMLATAERLLVASLCVYLCVCPSTHKKLKTTDHKLMQLQRICVGVTVQVIRLRWNLTFTFDHDS